MQYKDDHGLPAGGGAARGDGRHGAHLSRRDAGPPVVHLALAVGLALTLSLLAVVLTAAVSGPAGAQALPDTGGEIAPPAEDTGLDPNLPTDDAGDSGSNSRSCRLQDDAAEGLVPGAPEQDGDCLRDLTTRGTQETGHTNRQDWEDLNAEGTKNPSGVPGLQIDGYFPDDSNSNQNNGYDHDSQFVIRFPNDWNGKLVVTGAPGVRRQYANDFIMSDFFLAQGYAFAATDKGNTGIGFYEDGRDPGDAVAEGHRRVEQLTRATKRAVDQYYGSKELQRTYITGISNGGYLTRYALENTPELYDGGVDWEGTLYRPQGPNLFTWLPVALRNYPDYEASGRDRQSEAYENMIEGGYARGSEFLWDEHYAIYWDLTQRIYREEFDPRYDGPRGENGTPPGVPFCQDETDIPGCDANYNYDKRPERVKDAVRRVSLTGDIGKPMITLHGDLDTLLPIRTDSDPYRELIEEAGRASMHRYLVIGRGNHVDGFYDQNKKKLRPILPCYREAFVALDRAVDDGGRLPDSGFIPKPENEDVVNDCDLNDMGPRPDRGPLPEDQDPDPDSGQAACTITGTQKDDALNGTRRDDVICGLGGKDAIDGNGGDDTIRGGQGDDPIAGGDGNDTIEGGQGKDAVSGDAGGDRLDVRDDVRGNDAANGGPGRDTCRADQGDAVTGCS